MVEVILTKDGKENFFSSIDAAAGYLSLISSRSKRRLSDLMNQRSEKLEGYSVSYNDFGKGYGVLDRKGTGR